MGDLLNTFNNVIKDQPKFGAPFECWVPAYKLDSKGRQIGWIVGLNDNGVDFHARVQNGRLVDGNFHEFGVGQRSKRFSTQSEATNWAYRTARERIAKLK